MTDVGAVLVHGYLGAPASLRPLALALQDLLGPEAVTSVTLPGHGRGGAPPRFDAAAFLAEIRRAAAALPARALVLVGHSLGGSLALAAAAAGAPPALVVLAGTPPVIDAGYGERWSRQVGPAGPDWEDVAALVRFVNAQARAARSSSPLLVLQGEEDALVPAGAAARWLERGDQVRLRRLPGAGHDLFQGAAGAVAVDAVRRAVADLRRGPVGADEASGWAERAGLGGGLPGRWPGTLHHLRASPAGRALDGLEPDLAEEAAAEPTLLNLGVTTRCDLDCVACARTRGATPARDLTPELHERVLEAVPHAARVVLVGLGEPLLHPQVVGLVAQAARLGRRVSLVTNGMHLDRAMARALLEAGLAGLTVSLDTVAPATAARVRRGTDLDRVLGNLGAAVEERDRGHRGVGISVFTAVAADTLDGVPPLLARVRALGVDALMATDLNFEENAARSLHRAAAPRDLAALDGPLRAALTGGLPVLSVHGLEELALGRRYREFLLLRGADLAARDRGRVRCRSPWQTLPVGPDGEVTICDCQPGARVGNLLREPLAALWNGEAMRRQRRAMCSSEPPPACRACPRF